MEKVTTYTLYEAAVADIPNNPRPYGVARHTLTNGDVILCMVDAVAGSQVKMHYRTTWGRVPSGQKFKKHISRVAVVALLKSEPEK